MASARELKAVEDGLAKTFSLEDTSSNKEKESFLIGALERLLLLGREKRVRYPKLLYTLMDQCSEKLINLPKDRDRTGKAVYMLAGHFFKQGGAVKSWKDRWFVVDDTVITYYKDKKEWESGPVQGNPAKPQGTIPFSEVTKIYRCKSALCQEIKHEDRPKKGTQCLHIKNQDRTYHLVGFQDTESVNKWIDGLTYIWTAYAVRRDAKKYLREKAAHRAAEDAALKFDDPEDILSDPSTLVDIPKSPRDKNSPSELKRSDSSKGDTTPRSPRGEKPKEKEDPKEEVRDRFTHETLKKHIKSIPEADTKKLLDGMLRIYESTNLLRPLIMRLMETKEDWHSPESMLLILMTPPFEPYKAATLAWELTHPRRDEKG
eukprot:TRINITY_DN14981_c0_g1_i1.p1 TRINITY_DN14981_c0_g1~~TRINITY_DN14981_c0_g1_i1.p1  ORF type:complete len:374 (-),score=82.45 TRINITY_DN14981_c0_g1_i1:55-1176(-)